MAAQSTCMRVTGEVVVATKQCCGTRGEQRGGRARNGQSGDQTRSSTRATRELDLTIPIVEALPERVAPGMASPHSASGDMADACCRGSEDQPA